MTVDRDMAPIREAFIEALDEAVALRDLLMLLFMAAENAGDQQGAAMARGALTAQHALERLVTCLHRARDGLNGAGATDA